MAAGLDRVAVQVAGVVDVEDVAVGLPDRTGSVAGLLDRRHPAVPVARQSPPPRAPAASASPAPGPPSMFPRRPAPGRLRRTLAPNARRPRAQGTIGMIPAFDIDMDIPSKQSVTVKIPAVAEAPRDGFFSFYCKYHQTQGMSGRITVDGRDWLPGDRRDWIRRDGAWRSGITPTWRAGPRCSQAMTCSPSSTRSAPSRSPTSALSPTSGWGCGRSSCYCCGRRSTSESCPETTKRRFRLPSKSSPVCSGRARRAVRTGFRCSSSSETTSRD